MKQMRKGVLFMAVIAALSTSAEIPEGYYDEAVGKSGSVLQTTLATIIDHSDPGYDNLWDIYKTTDRRSDGKVWDMYSNTSDFTFGSDQCGNYSGEGDCYNREHSIPKSWRGGSKYSDAHIVVPTDGYVNNRRGNYPFGEVGSSSYVSDNSFSKLGNCVTSGYSGTVFEPNDEYKGDFARIYFYAATRYHNECGSWSGNGFSGSFPHLDEWVRVMMLRWHEQDPVSQKEIDRNDAVYASRQGNRNPFVDYPELVDLIFGDETTTPFAPGDVATAYLETPQSGDELYVGAVSLSVDNPYSSANLYIKGVNVEEDLILTLSGSSFFSISNEIITADAAVNGVNVTVTYAPLAVGNHTATLSIGGGIKKSVDVSLSGSAIEGFEALDATNVWDNSFQANWVQHSQANDYELAVWTVEGSGVSEQTLFDVSFASGVPSGWSSTGYTGKENQSVRLASGSQDGSVVTPSCNLSEASTLTVTCAPYKSSDKSVLYVLVDNVEVAQIDCADGEVTTTIELQPATDASTITLKAVKSHRVYLKSAQLTTGGGSKISMLDGYPCRVGDVASYLVENVQPEKDYYYKVTAFDGNTCLAESNTIIVTTTWTAVQTPQMSGVYIYANAGAIYVDNAPYNARINCYSLDGVLCSTGTVHSMREVIPINCKGIFVIQVITEHTSYVARVAMN